MERHNFHTRKLGQTEVFYAALVLMRVRSEVKVKNLLTEYLNVSSPRKEVSELPLYWYGPLIHFIE